MPSATDMTLIQRIEGAAEGSRELDALIWKVAAPVEHEERCSFRGKKYAGHVHTNAEKRDHIKRMGEILAPAYTTSIDVATSLLPNDTGFVLYNVIGKRPSVALQFGDEDFPAPKTADGWGDYSSGATPALALCAASLKARGVME